MGIDYGPIIFTIIGFVAGIAIAVLLVFSGIKVGKLVINAVPKNICKIIGIGSCVLGITLIIIGISNIIDLVKIIELVKITGAIVRSTFFVILGFFLCSFGIKCIISKKCCEKNVIVEKTST